ncbi:MAG: response regulator transcription factor [candidate division Zixibacteria bacterium]|nr:response regulator transcription factor [candidate division Zixibacteria bacterium]
MEHSILIVEDDRRIAALIAKNLEAAGFQCHQSYDGPQALSEFERLQPSLLVLDIMLPGLDGLEVTRRIRRKSKAPILMLTARSGEGDKVLGFEIGADDYLTKPFSTLELVARVRALLRRSEPRERQETLAFPGLLIDPTKREAERDGQKIALTTLEFDVLHFLALHPGRVYTREALMGYVWGDGRVVDGRSIDSVISRLRRKIEADPGHPRYVQTVWGAGYRFAESFE